MQSGGVFTLRVLELKGVVEVDTGLSAQLLVEVRILDQIVALSLELLLANGV